MRMYNLGMHCPGLPQDPDTVPWKWIMHWSRLLESDLSQRRLRQQVADREAARRQSKDRFMNALRAGSRR